MKFKEAPKVKPNNFQIRTRRVFLWLPVTWTNWEFKKETRWLEFAEVEECYWWGMWKFNRFLK